eukprot:Skav215240  [mRNA]  locus=scaffold811:66635:66820:- [translate_table: standard]
MGVPSSTTSLESLRSLNSNQRLSLLADMECLKQLLPGLEKAQPGVVWAIRIAIEDIEPMLT